MRLGEGQQLVNFTVVAREEDSDEEVELDEDGNEIVAEVTSEATEVVETAEQVEETTTETTDTESKTNE